eukprot:Awhi_evm1s14501
MHVSQSQTVPERYLFTGTHASLRHQKYWCTLVSNLVIVETDRLPFLHLAIFTEPLCISARLNSDRFVTSPREDLIFEIYELIERKTGSVCNIYEEINRRTGLVCKIKQKEGPVQFPIYDLTKKTTELGFLFHDRNTTSDLVIWCINEMGWGGKKKNDKCPQM